VFYGKLTRTTIPKILCVSLSTTKEHPCKVKKKSASFFIIYEKLKSRLFASIFCNLSVASSVSQIKMLGNFETKSFALLLISAPLSVYPSSEMKK